jgi:hypothetical protein
MLFPYLISGVLINCLQLFKALLVHCKNGQILYFIRIKYYFIINSLIFRPNIRFNSKESLRCDKLSGQFTI